MMLNPDETGFIKRMIKYILENAGMQDEFEYDIIDEYETKPERMEMPVLYEIERDQKKVYIIGVNMKGLKQHKAHNQYWFYAYPYIIELKPTYYLARRKTRVKDKWREKKWVNVYAPESFNSVPISFVPITDDEGAKGRVVEITLHDILKGEPSQNNYKIYFQIDNVEEDKATTIFKRYEYSKEFLRSLVRRGSSKINFIIDAKTKDGNIFRIKVIILTHRQLNTSRKHALRLIAKDIIEKSIPEMTIEQFVQATCYGEINAQIMASAKKLFRIRHVGLEKVKLVRTAEAQTVLLEA